jgi:hypothetical protein
METNLPSDIWWSDNIIPVITQERLKSFVTQALFDWNDFNHIKTSGVYGNMATTAKCDKVNIVPSDALIKLIYANDGFNQQIINKTAYWLGVSILDEYAKRNNVVITDIMRMKINNQTKSIRKEWDEETSCNEIHIDNYTPQNRTMVYYINDADGDTFLFDKLFDNKNKDYDLDLLMRVTPKQGRAVVFDSWRFHAPQNPTYTPRRYILNINFMEKSSEIS